MIRYNPNDFFAYVQFRVAEEGRSPTPDYLLNTLHGGTFIDTDERSRFLVRLHLEQEIGIPATGIPNHDKEMKRKSYHRGVEL